jgi:hypothetical protein
MTARQRLPDRRPAESFDIEVAGLSYTCTVGRFADGQIGELFLQKHKPGNQSDCNTRDAAVAGSLMFQLGCPLEVLRRALPRGSSRPPLEAAIDAIEGLR